MAALGATICNAFKWVDGSVTRYPSPMGLDNRRQATGRDSGGYPKTVTHIVFFHPAVKAVKTTQMDNL